MAIKDEASDIAVHLARSHTLSAKKPYKPRYIVARTKENQIANELLNTLPHSFDNNLISPDQLAPPVTVTEFIANAITDATLAYGDPQFISMVPARLHLALYLDPNMMLHGFSGAIMV